MNDIKDKYDYIGKFHQGVAIVVKDSFYGAILMGGHEIIAPSYDYISPFKDGYAQAIRKGECKILDLSGRECIRCNDKFIAIPPKYDSVRDFKNGYACVELNGKWGAIDTNGNEIFEPQFYYLSDFIGDTAKYKKEYGQHVNSWGYLNAKGFCSECNLTEPIIEPNGNLIIERFELGAKDSFAAFMGDEKPPQRVRINNEGQLLVKNGESMVALPKEFLIAKNFENGLAIVQDSTGYWGAVDVNGRIVIALQYTHIKSFSENKAFAINQNGKLCLISTNGTIIKEFPTYSDGDSFKGGYAIVTAGGKHGLINSNGKEILSPLDGYIHYTKNPHEFEITSSFFGGKHGLFMASTGLLIKPRFNKIIEIKKDCVKVEVDEVGESLIDLSGSVFVEKDDKRITFPDWCIGVKKINDNIFLGITDNGRWGLLDGSGETLCKPTFDNIGEVDNDIIPLIKTETITVGGWIKETKEITKYGLYNINSKVSIPVEYDVCPEYSNGYYKITSKGLLGIINGMGAVVLKPEWKQIHLSNGYYVVSKIVKEDYSEIERFGLATLSGNIILETKYKAISVLREGLYKVKEKYNSWSIFNDEGRLTKETYDEINLEGDYIIVSKAGLSGRLNEHAEKIIKLDDGTYVELPSKFSWGYDFKEGIAKVDIAGFDMRGVPCQNFVDKLFHIVIYNNNTVVAVDECVDYLYECDNYGNYIFVSCDKYGLLSPKGKVLIKASYDNLESIAKDLYIASIYLEDRCNMKHGVIDVNGNVIIDFNYHYLQPFYGRVLRSYLSPNINIELKDVEIPEKIEHLLIYNYGFGLIDLKGNMCILPGHKDIQKTEYGFILNKDNKYGYAALDYSIICEPKYASIEEVGNGFKRVSVSTSFGLRYGIMDQSGKECLEPIYISIGNMNKKGEADIITQGMKYGTVDSNYNIIKEPCEREYIANTTVDNISTPLVHKSKFGDNILRHECAAKGLVWIYEKGTEKIGLATDEGKILVEPKYGKIEPFINGYAKVNSGYWYKDEEYDEDDFPHWKTTRRYIDGSWGVINNLGQEVIPTKYSSIQIEEDGTYVVSKHVAINQREDCVVGLVTDCRLNKDGELIIKNEKGEYILADKKYDWQSDFDSVGRSEVNYHGDFGFVNKEFRLIVPNNISGTDNDIVIPEEYDWWYEYADGLIVVINKDGKYGVIDIDGQTLIAPIYDQIKVLSKNENILFNCGKLNDLNVYHWRLADVKGNIVTVSPYIKISQLGENLLLAETEQNKFTILDSRGRETKDILFDIVHNFDISTTIPPRNYYDKPQKIENQKYAIVGADGSYGLIDRKGKLVIAPKYKSITILENGCFWGNGVLYDINERRVIVNGNSVMIIPDGYFNAELLDNGLILVSNINKYGCERWGCINQVGTIIIPPLYHSLSYSAGLLLASICNDDDHLERTKKSGVIDFKNEIIVPFSDEYEEIQIQEKLILCKNKYHFDIWGAYTRQGAIICDPIYKEIVPISQFALKVCKETEKNYYGPIYKWGVITFAGNEILPFDYDSIANEPDNGLLEIQKDNRYGFIDVMGNMLLKPTYCSIGNFNHGYAIVSKTSYYYDEDGRDRERSVYGVINSQFKEIIPCVFDSIEYEVEIGRFKTDVGYKTIDGRYVAVVDGKELFVDKKYKYCKPFGDTCSIAVCVADGHVKYGLIDKQSNDILPPIFSRLDLIENELYKFKINDLYGLVTSKGNIILQNKYNSIGKFEDNLACVQVNVLSKKLYGYIDFSGNEILPPSYEFIGKRHHKYAVVMKNNLWGLFGIENHQLKIFPNVSFLGPCMENLCKINVGGIYDINSKKTTGGLWGYISVDGEIVIEPIYEQAYGFSDGMAAVKLNGKWGFINSEGIIVVPCEYDEIETSFKDGKGKLVKDDEIYIFDKSGSQIDTYDKPRDDDDYYDGGYYDDTPSIYDNPYYNDNLDMDQQSLEFWNSL